MANIEDLKQFIEQKKAEKEVAVENACRQAESDIIAPKFQEYDNMYAQVVSEAQNKKNNAQAAAQQAYNIAIANADKKYNEELEEAQAIVAEKKQKFADEQRAIARAKVGTDYDTVINKLNTVVNELGG